MERENLGTEYPAEASLGLYNILDTMGISDNNLKLHSVTRDFFDFAFYAASLFGREAVFGFAECILVGSTAEGPVILPMYSGMKTDIDILRVINSCKLHENNDTRQRDKHWHFLMEPCSKDSGYVRLKVKQEGVFPAFPFSTELKVLFDYESSSSEPYLTNKIPSLAHNAGFSNMLMQSLWQNLQMASVFTNVRVSGPSFSYFNPSELLPGSFTFDKFDIVPAIPCLHWPNAAKEWVGRNRMFGWPSREFISQQVRGGCFVVPVGCKQCDKSYSDWRLSFTQTEKALIHSFNRTQLKCLVLLKHMKNNYFSNPNDAISSYVIKTTLFWTIEETPADLWCPHNLLTAVQTCLDKLIMFIQSDFCPNYFIRSSNLLVLRYDNKEKHDVLQDCSKVRGHTLELLCNTAPFEKALQSRYIERIAFPKSFIDNDIFDKFVLFLAYTATEYGICPTLWLSLSCQQTIETATKFCKETLTRLKQTMHQKTTQNSIDLYNHTLTIVGDQLKKLLWTDCFQKKNNKSKYACHKALLPIIKDTKYVSSMVTVCHLHAAVGNYETCNKKLKEIICNLKDKPHLRISHPGRLLTEFETGCVEIASTMLTFIMNENIFELPFIGDICFTRFEIAILPLPLQMEIYSDRGSTRQYDISAGLGKTVIVDSLVYACFLRFWCCMVMDRNIEKLEARNDMVWVCSLPNTSNKAVAFNLLGYCHNQLEEYNRAFLAFCNALKQNPKSPATIIHIGAIINDKLWREWSETCPE